MKDETTNLSAAPGVQAADPAPVEQAADPAPEQSPEAAPEAEQAPVDLAA